MSAKLCKHFVRKPSIDHLRQVAKKEWGFPGGFESVLVLQVGWKCTACGGIEWRDVPVVQEYTANAEGTDGQA